MADQTGGRVSSMIGETSAPSRRRTRRRFVPVAAAGLAIVLAACAPSPTHSIDQSNTGGVNSFASVAWSAPCFGTTVDAEVAQTFTAGRTGLLDQVSVAAMPIAPGSQAPFLMTIRTVRADGAPSATVLGSGTYAGPGSPTASTLIQVPLASPAVVLAGHRYSIVISSVPAAECTDDLGWSVFGASDTYGGGEAWYRGTAYNTPNWVAPDPSQDLFFVTWMC